MDGVVLATTLAAAGAVIGILRSAMMLMTGREQREERTPWGALRDALRSAFGKADSEGPTIEARLDELSRTMVRSARLLEQVTTEIDARREIAEQAKQEAEEARTASTLTGDQLALIHHMTRSETDRGIRAAVWVGLLSFVLGGAVAVLVTYFVHPGWDHSGDGPVPGISAAPSPTR